jgi:CCR4-NOT transcription complex subunit 7/8
MRVGSSHTAGSDSLLTASTFFKTRTLYFSDAPLPESEFNGRLFGLGPVFAFPNAAPDPSRGGATLAEREDRGSVAASVAAAVANNAAGGANAGGAGPQGGPAGGAPPGTPGFAHTPASLQASALVNSMAAPQAYGSMAAAGGAFLRSAMGQR